MRRSVATALLALLLIVTGLWWFGPDPASGSGGPSDAQAGESATAGPAPPLQASSDAADEPLAGRRTDVGEAGVGAVAEAAEEDALVAAREALVGCFLCAGPRFDWPVELTWYPKFGGAEGERHVARTDADGSFRMLGEAYAGGALRFPGVYEITRIEGAIDPELQSGLLRFGGLTGPLILHAALQDGYVGRLLDEEAPVADARADYRWVRKSPMQEEVQGGTGVTDSEGRFLVPTGRFEAPTELVLEFRDGTSGAQAKFVVPAEELRDDRELGDFTLEKGRAVTLRVRDQEGQPVVGAEVQGSSILPAPSSDDAGVVALERLVAAPVLLRVRKAGYLERKVALEEDRQGEVEVILEPTTRVELILYPAAGTRGDDYQYHYPGAGEGERGGNPYVGNLDLLPYGNMGGHGTREGGMDWEWQARADLPQYLSGLPSGVPLTLQLSWRGLVVEERILDPLREREHRRVDFRPSIPGTLMQVRAVDLDGTALTGVVLSSKREEGTRWTPLRPELDGRWLIPDTDDPEHVLLFEKPGYLSREIHGVCPEQVVMRPGGSLAIRLQAPDGAWIVDGVDIEVRYAALSGGWASAAEASWAFDERFHFPQVPFETVQVSVAADGYRPVEAEHDVRSGDLLLQLQPQE